MMAKRHGGFGGAKAQRNEAVEARKNRGGAKAKVTWRLRRHEGTEKVVEVRDRGGAKAKETREASEARRHRGTKQWRHKKSWRREGKGNTEASEARRHRGTKRRRHKTVEARWPKRHGGFGGTKA